MGTLSSSKTHCWSASVLNFSPSCERNKEAIYHSLNQLFSSYLQENDTCHVLEVGSLSGQHAIYFCQQMPALVWQSSDIKDNHSALVSNINQSSLGNCLAPIVLNVAEPTHWPDKEFDWLFSANTLHIMSWPNIEAFFQQLSTVVKPQGYLTIYGPFKYQGRYTSESNEAFQSWLTDRDINSGIRDFEKVNELARAQGFSLISDQAMPANNQLLTWIKR